MSKTTVQQVQKAHAKAQRSHAKAHAAIEKSQEDLDGLGALLAMLATADGGPDGNSNGGDN